jgi:hypothetical protein
MQGGRLPPLHGSHDGPRLGPAQRSPEDGQPVRGARRRGAERLDRAAVRLEEHLRDGGGPGRLAIRPAGFRWQEAPSGGCWTPRPESRCPTGSADASGRQHSRVGPRCRGASRVDPARRLGGAGGRRRVPHSGGVRGDIHSGTSLRPRKCRRTASVFIDLGLDGGPILLGLVAAGSGIPTAFLAAAIVTAVGAALLLSRPAPPSQRPAERSA